MSHLRLLRTGVLAIAGLLASACGSSSTGKAGLGPDGGSTGSGGGLGATCSQSQECQSQVCLRFTANAEGATGICSAICSTGGSASTSGAECGSGGACVPVPDLDAGACFPACSGAGGCSGIPCIWNPTLDAGICQPLPTEFCTEIATQGACEGCLGTSCCSSLTACAEDVACSQLESACSAKPACANMLQASDNAAARALGSCVASSCATACQAGVDAGAQ
jgi:hypothetical protein